MKHRGSWTDGDLEYYDDHLVAVRVVDYGDGVGLWRTGLYRDPKDATSVTFKLRSLDNNPMYANTPLFAEGREYTLFIPTELRRRLPVEGEEWTRPEPYYRWALTELGLMAPGTTPMPYTDVPMLHNPFVGRFRARTFEEALSDAAKLDEMPKPDGTWWVPLFAPGTGMHARWVTSRSAWHCRLERARGTGEKGSWQQIETFNADNLVDAVRLMNGMHVNADNLVDAVRLMDGMHAGSKGERRWSWWSWRVMPQDDADRWLEENTRVGRLTLPEEELELFRLLGQRLPYLWPDDEFKVWALERAASRQQPAASSATPGEGS